MFNFQTQLFTSLNNKDMLAASPYDFLNPNFQLAKWKSLTNASVPKIKDRDYQTVPINICRYGYRTQSRERKRLTKRVSPKKG